MRWYLHFARTRQKPSLAGGWLFRDRRDNVFLSMFVVYFKFIYIFVESFRFRRRFNDSSPVIGRILFCISTLSLFVITLSLSLIYSTRDDDAQEYIGPRWRWHGGYGGHINARAHAVINSANSTCVRALFVRTRVKIRSTVVVGFAAPSY